MHPRLATHQRALRSHRSHPTTRSSRARLGAIVAGALVVLGALVGCAATATPVGFAASGSDSAPVATATSTPTPKVTVTTEQITETQPIPYESVSVDDAAMDQGTTAVVVGGVAGTLTRTIEVIKHNGVEVSRSTLSEVATTAPVTEETHVGTRVPAPVVAVEAETEAVGAPTGGSGDCDPNYSGACVPIASDVDCAGGGGDGPAYVEGPVYIVGGDPYKLDRNDDGIACDG